MFNDRCCDSGVPSISDAFLDLCFLFAIHLANVTLA